MLVDINELIHLCVNTNMLFRGVFFEDSRQNGGSIRRRTNPLYGGVLVPLMGNIRITLGDTEYLVQPGVILHAGPHMYFSVESMDDKPWKFAVLHYYLNQNEGKDISIHYNNFPIFVEMNARITDLIHQLSQLQLSPGIASLFQAKRLFIQFLGEIFDASQKLLEDDNISTVKQITLYIREHYGQILSVAQVAEEFHLDRRRLTELFEQYVGMPPGKYLIECRLLKAEEMLHTSGYSIKQISEYIGYSDSLYFSKAFKKKYGISPSQYRKEQ